MVVGLEPLTGVGAKMLSGSLVSEKLWSAVRYHREPRHSTWIVASLRIVAGNGGYNGSRVSGLCGGVITESDMRRAVSGFGLTDYDVNMVLTAGHSIKPEQRRNAFRQNFRFGARHLGHHHDFVEWPLVLVGSQELGAANNGFGNRDGIIGNRSAFPGSYTVAARAEDIHGTVASPGHKRILVCETAFIVLWPVTPIMRTLLPSAGCATV